jgi:hypothetical protein
MLVYKIPIIQQLTPIDTMLLQFLSTRVLYSMYEMNVLSVWAAGERLDGKYICMCVHVCMYTPWSHFQVNTLTTVEPVPSVSSGSCG